DRIRTLDMPYEEQVELSKAVTDALGDVDKKYFGVYHKETGAFSGYNFVHGSKAWQDLTGKKPPIEVTGDDVKTVSAADTLKDTIKNQKGSITIESGSYPDLVSLSRNIISQGHDTFKKFRTELKRQMAEVWEKVKRLARALFSAAKKPLEGERGGVTLERKAPKKAAVPPTPPQAPIEKDTGFDEEKDIWIGNKDEQVLRNNAEAINLQDSIKEALGKKKYDKEAQDMDKAIHRYLDLKRNPKHLKEFYGEIPKEQQRIVDIVKTIDQNPKLKQIADTISESYKQIGQIALDEGVIFNVLDNYVSRVWKVRKTKAGQPTDLLQKFKTTSRHAKHRVFETVLEGMAVKDKEGNHVFSLQIEGATNNLNALKDEIARTIEDKHLIDRLKVQEHEDTGLKVISHIQHEGYDWIEHPNFVYWQYIGTVEGGEIKDYYTTADGRK
ncbi:hypothetical protein LCGC14_2684490, partial [marine sediment metagenome]